MHMAQQQQLLQQQQARQAQAARQAMMAQQSFGMPMNMPNGINPQMGAQFAAMRGAPNMRPVNLPQHLQQQQQQAQLGLEQQQAAQQQHAQQQQHQVSYYYSVILVFHPSKLTKHSISKCWRSK